jgi:hypothetical protein
MESLETTTTENSNESEVAYRRIYLTNRIKSGIGWFYWIAGLSLVNSVLFLLGATFSSVVGLAATLVIDAFMTGVAKGIGSDIGLVFRVVGFVIDLIIAGIFIGIGYLGVKRFRWVVVLGMVFYLIDALIYLLFRGWMSAAFHAWALWNMWQGLQAINKLNALEKSIAPETAFPT